MLNWAVKEAPGPVAVRYPRGGDRRYAVSAWNPDSMFDICREGEDLTIVTYGAVTANIMEAEKILTERGVAVTVLRLLAVSPLPDAALLKAACKGKNVLVVEETMASSGIGCEIAHMLPQHQVQLVNLGDQFVTHGSLDELYCDRGMDPRSIADLALEVLKNEN